MLETERCIIREYQPEDFDALYEIFSDAETMAHYPHPFSKEEVQGWMQRNYDRYKTFGFGLWAVVLKETNEVIGDVGITMQMINGTIKPEVGYHINKKYWRQGLAKECSHEVLRWVFESTPFQEIYSYMKYTNVGSFSTAEGNGFKCIEQYADPVNEYTKVYLLTREEWIAQNAQK